MSIPVDQDSVSGINRAPQSDVITQSTKRLEKNKRSNL